MNIWVSPMQVTAINSPEMIKGLVQTTLLS